MQNMGIEVLFKDIDVNQMELYNKNIMKLGKSLSAE